MNVAADNVEEAVSKATAIIESTEAWRYIAARSSGNTPKDRQTQGPS